MVRVACMQDFDAIMAVFQLARQYMVEHLNPTQWGESYPTKELLLSDMDKNQLYVVEDDGKIHGAFVFIIGEDPSYAHIEEGEWLNQERYGTIHRVAGDGKQRGVFSQCMSFCKAQIANLRIDTHHNNQTMQHLIEKAGFTRCGIVYMEDTSARIAYQLVL